MADYPHLTNAPIAEAVIEIRAEVPAPIQEGRYAEFAEHFRAKYPHSTEVRFAAPHIQLGTEDRAILLNADVSKVGVRMESEDHKDVIIAKNDGLTVSRLQPYKNWDSLIAVAREVWPRYTASLAPAFIVRLGVRYINRISLPVASPEERVDLDSIFTAGPKVPPTLPQTLSQFQSRLMLPVDSHGAALGITQSTDPVFQPGLVSVLLDIDAFSQVHFEPADPALWTQLERLHNLKNMAFFGSVQKTTWERYI